MNQTKILLKKMMILIIVSAFFTAFFGIAMPVAEAIPDPTRIKIHVWYDENGLFHKEKTIEKLRFAGRIITGIMIRRKEHHWYDKNGYIHVHNITYHPNANNNHGNNGMQNILSKNNEEEYKKLYDIPDKQRYWYDEHGLLHLEETRFDERNRKSKSHIWYGKDGQKFEVFVWYDKEGHEHVSLPFKSAR